MALHKDFPGSPFVILESVIRWFPVDEALRETSTDKLMPPLVSQLRKKVKESRPKVRKIWMRRSKWNAYANGAKTSTRCRMK